MSRARAGTLVVALTLLSVGTAACGGGPAGADGGVKVAAADFRFEPKRVELPAGNTVTWTNTGQTAHTVKGPGFFSARAMDPGQSYSHRFGRPGTYAYLCTLHPTLMKGVVVVG